MNNLEVTKIQFLSIDTASDAFMRIVPTGLLMRARIGYKTQYALPLILPSLIPYLCLTLIQISRISIPYFTRVEIKGKDTTIM